MCYPLSPHPYWRERAFRLRKTRHFPNVKKHKKLEIMSKKKETVAPVQSAVVNEVKNVEVISTSPMSAADYLKMIEVLGEKRLLRASEIGRNIPLQGTFAQPVLRDAVIDKVKVQYPAFPILNDQNVVIGYIAVNSLLASRALKTAYKIVKEGSKYVGLYGVNSERVNPQLVGSEAAIASSLVGKHFRASNPEEIVPKLQFDKKTGNCLHFKKTEEDAILQVEPKKVFVISELS